MKDRKEYIIRKAMELYATKGYQNVSITDLQFALDIGRGTLYYYFRDQDDLFLKCMEKYFIEPKQRALNNVPEDAGIEEMIHSIEEYLLSLEEALQTFDNKAINTSNVNGLMFSLIISNAFTSLGKAKIFIQFLSGLIIGCYF